MVEQGPVASHNYYLNYQEAWNGILHSLYFSKYKSLVFHYLWLCTRCWLTRKKNPKVKKYLRNPQSVVTWGVHEMILEFLIFKWVFFGCFFKHLYWLHVSTCSSSRRKIYFNIDIYNTINKVMLVM